MSNSECLQLPATRSEENILTSSALYTRDLILHSHHFYMAAHAIQLLPFPFFPRSSGKFLDLWCIPFSNKRKISKEEDNRTSDDTFLNHRLANLGSKRRKYLLSCFLIYLIHCVHPYCPPML